MSQNLVIEKLMEHHQKQSINLSLNGIYNIDSQNCGNEFFKYLLIHNYNRLG